MDEEEAGSEVGGGEGMAAVLWSACVAMMQGEDEKPVCGSDTPIDRLPPTSVFGIILDRDAPFRS